MYSWGRLIDLGASAVGGKVLGKTQASLQLII